MTDKQTLTRPRSKEEGKQKQELSRETTEPQSVHGRVEVNAIHTLQVFKRVIGGQEKEKLHVSGASSSASPRGTAVEVMASACYRLTRKMDGGRKAKRGPPDSGINRGRVSGLRRYFNIPPSTPRSSRSPSELLSFHPTASIAVILPRVSGTQGSTRAVIPDPCDQTYSSGMNHHLRSLTGLLHPPECLPWRRLARLIARPSRVGPFFRLDAAKQFYRGGWPEVYWSKLKRLPIRWPPVDKARVEFQPRLSCAAESTTRSCRLTAAPVKEV
ncbi:unnamed protein product [Pleuronectes platessa]|uniref:Uncharacterized protein n=1 Tax=Pleuronectes platessa TaxID=8262 RepID=A0A9N7UR11_PLEPL|nr:unnamed protein product [Pleuronectes platessa]